MSQSCRTDRFFAGTEPSFSLDNLKKNPYLKISAHSVADDTLQTRLWKVVLLDFDWQSQPTGGTEGQ